MKTGRIRKVLLLLSLVLAVPLVFVALIAASFAYHIWQFDPNDLHLADSTEAQLGENTIRLDRYPLHPFLAEYKRVLTVVNAAGERSVRELFPDTGGGQKIEVCEIVGGDFLLVDRFGAYVLQPSGTFRVLVSKVENGGLVRVMNPAVMPDCVRPVGRFDRDEKRSYGFHLISG